MPYDAIIVGARVAGATTALLLAQKGYSVLLLDQDQFPSGTLSTHLFFTDTMAVFERIGVLDRVLAIARRTDARVAELVERQQLDPVILRVLPHVARRPGGERRDFSDRSSAWQLERLDLFEIGPAR